VGVEDQHPTFAFAPLPDVLPDEIFEKFGLASAGAATNIQVFVAFGA
jgi:hypothetical protein